MAQTTFDAVPLVPRWQAEQARVDPEHLFAEHKFMQDEIDALREQLDAALARIDDTSPPVGWETLGDNGDWVAITAQEFELLQAHGVGHQRRLYDRAMSPEPRS